MCVLVNNDIYGQRIGQTLPKALRTNAMTALTNLHTLHILHILHIVYILHILFFLHFLPILHILHILHVLHILHIFHISNVYIMDRLFILARKGQFAQEINYTMVKY